MSCLSASFMYCSLLKMHVPLPLSAGLMYISVRFLRRLRPILCLWLRLGGFEEFSLADLSAPPNSSMNARILGRISDLFGFHDELGLYLFISFHAGESPVVSPSFLA